MNVKRVTVLVLAAASLATSGCALLLVGAGVAGGYAISKDSVQNLFDLPKDRVFDQSLAVAKEVGMVNLEDRAHGRIKTQMGRVTVTITTRQVTKRTVELKVKARNDLMLPEVDTAQEVYTKIIERL